MGHLSEAKERTLGVLLLGLAALEAWTASAIFPWHPWLASASTAQAVLLVATFVLTWNLATPPTGTFARPSPQSQYPAYTRSLL